MHSWGWNIVRPIKTSKIRRDKLRASPLVEVCVADIEFARAAVAAGADRLELNSRLDVDGLTPCDELVRLCVAEFDIPVIAMARPDSGNNGFETAGFIYSDSDWQRLTEDAQRMLDLGVAGIAAGPLAKGGNPDEHRVMHLREMCGDRELVFHRAFDVTTDWRSAFETLIDCSVDRILTSGTAATAVEGTGVLRWMVDQGGIEILPACGITALNAELVISETGCDQIHGSFSRLTAAGTETGLPPEIVVAELGRLAEHFRNG